MIVKYTKAEFDALIEKKLKEAIETGFKERSQFTTKELLEQMIEIDDEGEESLAEYEAKIEQEEDERDEKEKKKKEKETERKKVLSQKKKYKDNAFCEKWYNKIKGVRDLIPQSENGFRGKGREKKYKSYFRKQATLFLQEIKKLNIGGGVND